MLVSIATRLDDDAVEVDNVSVVVVDKTGAVDEDEDAAKSVERAVVDEVEAEDLGVTWDEVMVVDVGAWSVFVVLVVASQAASVAIRVSASFVTEMISLSRR